MGGIESNESQQGSHNNSELKLGEIRGLEQKSRSEKLRLLRQGAAFSPSFNLDRLTQFSTPQTFLRALARIAVRFTVKNREQENPRIRTVQLKYMQQLWSKYTQQEMRLYR
jgi:hypothetical protein